ncbi:cupin domain-containing protein [Mycobacterium tuberculosis]|uniref:cupin domain-containing protein n=3 Tax=Mycobacterium tuberculosis TaxID=1773 RepID=UPI003365146F
MSIVKQYRAHSAWILSISIHCSSTGRIVWPVVGDVNPARTGASVNVDRRCAAGNRRALRRSQTRVPRIRQGSAKSAGTRCCHVRQQRQGGRAVRGAGLVRDSGPGGSGHCGRRLGQSGPCDRGGGAETVWHRLQATDEIYFVLSGRGLVSVGDESGEVGPGDAVWIPAGVPQKIRALGSVPLTFLCACGPAYLPERDQRMGEAAVIGAWP